MATPTTTIRVSRDTRDLLARQAKDRGMSLSALLSNLARRETREEIFRLEREAIVADRGNPAAVVETADWDAVTDDGIK